jgi:hypothetical protein
MIGIAPQSVDPAKEANHKTSGYDDSPSSSSMSIA